MKKAIFASYKDWLNEQKMPKGKRATLLSALDLFAEHGYDGTSTMAIAEHANVSQATIFKYFKTKEDLLKAIVVPVVNNLLPDYRDDFLNQVPAPEKLTIRQMVHFFITNRFEFLQQNAQAVTIFFSELLINQEIRKIFVQFAEETQPVFMEVIYNRLENTGHLREEMTPLSVFRTVGGQLLTYFFQREKMIPTLPVDEAADLKRMEDIIVWGISTEK